MSDVSDVIDDGSSVVGGRSPKAFHHARTNFSSTDVDVSLCTIIKKRGIRRTNKVAWSKRSKKTHQVVNQSVLQGNLVVYVDVYSQNI